MDFAVDAALWVVGKALAPVTDGLLESWAASAELGPNIDALKMQLLYAQGMLDNAQDKDIRSSALKEMLHKLRQLAYAADDVLDELGYFRIQDTLDGTYHAADADGLVLNARHTVRSVANKLKVSSRSRGDLDDQEDGGRQGCLSLVRSCGRRENRSSPSLPTNQGGQEVGCARNAAHTIGKHFPCYSSPSVCDNNVAHTVVVESSNMTSRRRFLCDAWPSKARQNNHVVQTSKLKFDRVQMSTKIMEIVGQLKPLCAMVSTILDKELLGLAILKFGSNHTPIQNSAANRPKTTPIPERDELYGRDNQKKEIVDGITHGKFCTNKLTVLALVGPGGIGKTTLTQHIYRELEKSLSFEVSVWICVSLDFNADRLTQEILKKIPKVNDEDKNASIEKLIEQRLKSKRLLLVLDDMWMYQEDEWEKLLAPLRYTGGEKNNVVIVTTRIPQVATMVSPNSSIDVERLGPEDIKSFFQVCVFGDKENPWKDHLQLEDIGSKIVSNLKGFPLAAKTVGRLLRNKLTVQHWTRVAESKEWELQTGPDDIMPALKLSYDYLPFHLQQCFFYCALFPEDYEFGRKELVHFWIGLGILRFHEHKRVEDVGLGYLDDLVNHGFFKEIKKKGGLYYVIHDLLHELAVKVSSYECLSIRSSNVKHIRIPLTVRHLSIIVDNVDVKDRESFEDYKSDLGRRLGTKLEIQNLRTLMLFGEYHGSFIKTFRALFREATAIRTILLSEASYSLEDMLQDFSKHIHLRYLRITSVGNNEICLPSALSRSYHLEVIDLEELHANFSLMTRDMSNLIKLRHFLVPGDNFELHSNIVVVGKLKFLEELRRFEVRKDTKGFELTQLGELTKLGGSLGIYNLEIVQTKEEAKEIKLSYKSNLHKLILEWGNKDVEQDANVLESLVPHKNLRHLCIKGHGGANCPSWLGQNISIKNLESLCVYDVSWNTLPPLGDFNFINDPDEGLKGLVSSQRFQTLKKLKLVNISNLKRWVKNDDCHFFSCLEVVKIKDCPELLELPFSLPARGQAEEEKNMRTLFPKLKKLAIVNCPHLSLLPPIPWSPAPCSIKIENAGSVFEKLVYPKDDGSRFSLQILGKDGQQSMVWSGLAFHNLTDLEELEIDNCPPLPVIHLEKLKSLKTLNMHKMGNTLLWFEGESHKMESPLPVEHIWIESCGANGKELTQVLSYFPKLTYLSIFSCEKITGMVLNVVERQKVATSPSENKTEQAHRAGHQQQQTTGEEEFAAAREELLLLPPQLQELWIGSCPNLVLSTSPGFGGGEFQSLCSLRSLDVSFCDQFFNYSSSASSCSPFPASLQELWFDKVGGTEMLLPLSNLTSLTILCVQNCGDLRGEGLWPLVAQGCLTSLDIRETPKFFSGAEPSWLNEEESRSSPSRVESMTIPNFAGVFTRPICRLLSSSLTELTCWEDKEAERFTAEQEEALQLLTSLQKLTFYECEKLRLLPASLSKLTNLKKLNIWGCPALWSLPNDGFPSCLEKLRISNCPAIKALPDHGLPSSLQNLEIDNCPAIKSLPSNLPTSLQELEICRCPGIKSLPKEGLNSLRVLDVSDDDNSKELRRQCHKLKGTITIVYC